MTGLPTTLNGKADLVHDHNALYQKKYAKVVVVAKSGGDYTSPVEAMNSITDASATNPYLLKIMRGVYDLGSGALTMKECVDIEDSGENTTIITGIGDPSTVNGASNTEIRLLTVRSTGGGAASYAIANFGVSTSAALLSPSTQAAVQARKRTGCLFLNLRLYYRSGLQIENEFATLSEVDSDGQT